MEEDHRHDRESAETVDIRAVTQACHANRPGRESDTSPYPDFRSFAGAMIRLLKSTLTDKWHEVRDNITEYFHIVCPGNLRGVG